MFVKILFFLFIVAIFPFPGQTVSPTVINSSGASYVVTLNLQPAFYSDNIGEPFVSTISNSNYHITQGFLQPELRPEPYISYTIQNVSCLDKKNGSIHIELKNLSPSDSYTIKWFPAGSCTNIPCFVIDSLSGGSYTVVVTIQNAAGTKTLSENYVVNDSSEPCEVKIFNGITLSGNNPFLYLENIEQYPNNSISIYSRWGNHITTIDGYNNRDKRWPSGQSRYPEGTYYYILYLNKRSKPIKGWLELLD